MHENIVGVTGIGIGSPEHRRHEMADGFWMIGIRNIDGPEAGIFPGAENNIAFDHTLDVVNAEAPARPIRWTESIERQAESSDLDGIGFMTDIDHMEVAERTLFCRGNLIGGENNVRPTAVRRYNDADTVGIAFLGRGPLDLADLGRFLEIADIQDDDALIAVRKIGAVFVRGQVVQ